MKTCKNCNFQFSGLELSSVVRFSALYNIFRLILLHGIMLMIFLGCTNLQPAFPEGRSGTRVKGYLLYNGTREELTDVETTMLHNVQKSCGRMYRNALPEIWEGGRPILIKAIKYLSVAIVLPGLSAAVFLLVYKKDRISSYIAVIHFVIEMISISIGLYGAWFISDSRLCFLGAFDKHYNIHAFVWAGALISAVLQKILLLYSLRLYMVRYYKSRALYSQPPTPEEELKLYLKELKAMGIKPEVNIEPLPSDPDKVSVALLNSQIKKALQDVRLQVAKYYKDDPLVGALLSTGKLGRLLDDKKKRRVSGASSTTTPGILKIAEILKSVKGNEYKLLSNHPQSNQRRSSRDTQNTDDVAIILPDPSSRKPF